ncbi:hypothetical protein KEJ48_05155 [Candidatus Bathyarchaeota archaeon]|nr:hypothetical protein [Candidatus Bathyarchaeota archaeon]
MSFFTFDWRWINPFEWGNAIRDALIGSIQNIIANLHQYVITPLMNAIMDFTRWFWDNLVTLFNSLFSALINFIYTWIVNPIIGLFQTALNRLRDKMRGILYITITMPLLIKEAKSLHEAESLYDMFRKGLFFIFKPVIGYFTTEILYAVISGYLQPVYIPPVTPPTPPSLPKIGEININVTDYVSVTDSTSITLTTYPSIFDTVAINDIVTVELIIGERVIEVADEVSINDSVTVELISPPEILIDIYDDVVINDEITVELL